MIELEHSPLGGSSAYRFLACTFSFLEHRRQLQSGTFVEIPTPFSALGVGAHELGALCLTDASEPFEHVGETFNGFRAGWADEIDLDAVSIYVDFCRNLVDKLKDFPDIYLVEKTIHLPNVHPLLKGTVDWGMVNAYGLWLVDYKNGEGVGVSAINSPQLMYYAFLMILATFKVGAPDADFPVHLSIVQPNFYGVFEEPETWTTTAGHVMEWGFGTLIPEMNRLMDRREAATEEDANPGDHCQFCPVMLHCPKLKKAFIDFADADEDFITMLTDPELDALYEQRTYARRFMNELDKVVYARKVTGGEIPSAKLVEKKVARVWKPGAEAVLKQTFGPKAMAAPKILSPAGIEKLSTRGKELAKEWGYKPETHALTIAPLSDPRSEARARTNETVFSAFKQSYEDAGF